MRKDSCVKVVEDRYPKGIKWTRQRACVYEVLKSAEEPLSAIQIYRRVLKRDTEAAYAVSTIYRILAAFEEKSMVHKDTRLDDGNVVYELNRGEHVHYAVCLECHKRVPLKSCPFVRLHPEAEPREFTVTGHKLELYGYCSNCREKK